MIVETLLVALRSVRANVLRSLLTCLGIVIGIASVIAMVALGEGAQESVKEQLEAMGSNLLFVRATQARAGGVAQGQEPLTVDDADMLRERASAGIVAVVPQMSGSFQVEHLDRNSQTSVTGTTPEFLDVEGFTLERGRFFGEGEVAARRRVAVIGAEVARNLETTSAALLGSTVRIRGTRFEVIGVLASKGQASWSNPDDQIVIPLSTAQLRLVGSDRLRSITVKVASSEQISTAMADIRRVLRRSHRLRDGEDDDFSIRDQTDLRATVESTARTFSMLLAGIAAISLLVGGIGIMNIMMVSVTERTREIGVRKAMGATRSLILLQFLVEALLLCLLGGLLGIAVGTGASTAMARMAGWRTIVKPEAVVLAVATAAAVGIFFGIYPAGRASRLDPIEALRYE